MKYIWLSIISICLLFSTGYARDLPDLIPQLEVTGLVISKTKKVKSAAILNGRIVREGDLFEVDADGKLGTKVVRGGRVKVGPITVLVQKITDKGVTIKYVEQAAPSTDGRAMGLIYQEVRVISLKARPSSKDARGRLTVKCYGLHK